MDCTQKRLLGQLERMADRIVTAYPSTQFLERDNED